MSPAPNPNSKGVVGDSPFVGRGCAQGTHKPETCAQGTEATAHRLAEPLYKDLAEMRMNGNYVDMGVQSGTGRAWKGHRAVVCSQSCFIAAALDGPLKVREMTRSYCLCGC